MVNTDISRISDELCLYQLLYIPGRSSPCTYTESGDGALRINELAAISDAFAWWVQHLSRYSLLVDQVFKDPLVS